MKAFHSLYQSFSLFLFAFLMICYANASGQKKADLTSDLSADSSFSEATNFMFQGRIDQSISSFVKAANGFQKSENTRQTIACYLGIATCYTLKGEFRKSLEFNEKALLLHKNKMTNDPEGLDLIMNNVALCKEAQRLSNGATKVN